MTVHPHVDTSAVCEGFENSAQVPLATQRSALSSGTCGQSSFFVPGRLLLEALGFRSAEQHLSVQPELARESKWFSCLHVWQMFLLLESVPPLLPPCRVLPAVCGTDMSRNVADVSSVQGDSLGILDGSDSLPSPKPSLAAPDVLPCGLEAVGEEGEGSGGTSEGEPGEGYRLSYASAPPSCNGGELWNLFPVQ